ncbi:MAG: XdhC family protein [Rhodospirillaceae bacterium]|jgi:xanthine/CO dehydrogenase XdhC/CoxF family maturation factor|nr:XdhC family protein [Rhodospirillaceae bacterium]MBT5564472.1 XdhC family protein [Rhodospirillaceae bacterium]MBT6089762.1 XdhC family protein [Rhodospirillaceae bacterium]MBT7451310.1 XdhC family protein [Rhodospirillaceae bacterium]
MHDVDADPLDRLAEWRSSGKKTALATVVRTWGSSPRPVGSHLAVCEDGDFAGSVSGGCIEGSVIEAALETIASGDSARLEFGVTNDMAWEVGLACGGTVHVYVESIV